MARTFQKWQTELDQIVREEMHVPLDEVMDVDKDVMHTYFEEHMAPRLFFNEQINMDASGEVMTRDEIMQEI